MQKVRGSWDRRGDWGMSRDLEAGAGVLFLKTRRVLEKWSAVSGWKRKRGNRDGYLSGVSEFESEGRKWNGEEPQLMGSHQRGIEELLLPGMSWGGVGALYHNGKIWCVSFSSSCRIENHWVAFRAKISPWISSQIYVYRVSTGPWKFCLRSKKNLNISILINK